jgi:signal transduction histidine kinase
LNPTTQSPAKLAQQAFDRLRTLASAKDIRLVAKSNRDVPDVVADHDAALEMLIELVGTAIEVTPDGGTITFDAEYDCGCVVISVADGGPRLSSDEGPHFGDRAGRPCPANAENVVDARHGGLWIESNGKGNAVLFTLAPAPDAAS